MNDSLRGKIEEIIGKINTVDLLVEQGCTSEVRKIETIKGLYLLKSAFKEKYRMWLKEEARILENINIEKQIPVPDYYGFIEDDNSSNLIVSFENGTTLTTALREAKSLTERKSLIKSFGLFLHQFHEKEPIKVLEQKNDWLERQLVKAQYYVENGQTEGSKELLNQLIARKPFSVKQTMIHGDCTTDNVLVKNGEVKLFIDIAGMTVGDPRYDISLAISDFVDDPELLNTFYDGYIRYRVSSEEFHYFNDGLYEFF
ncbi:aminoglycoside phosphotransferase family protein [Caldibacillus lycopersici]|uniref:Aminoglycoside phosphotransferase family protein n=1 Tax=Perspicuibacillus lycopersici TaxID=1325689 RepID=A0AAE3LP20_9BACI|nr:aminoglycoside phosphotransferase family protein [Perspicuibacillus lycopersici]MCU9614531.1 aminoglycoside phosphotransferase family protein [Perspicuibacillus lycopersici]